MSDDDSIAFTIRPSDNDDNNVGNYEVIRRDEIQPLNDPNCEHDMILDPDGDEIGDTRAWVCSKCHRGVFLPKSVTAIT